MSPLNSNQVRRIVSTFTYVDTLLQNMERQITPSPSPFVAERADITPDEGRLLASFAALARTRMMAALERLGLPPPRKRSSARWNAETALRLADITLSEMGRKDLRAYGEVDVAVAEELTALVTDLRGILDRAMRTFHEGDEGGLSAALATLPGAVGNALRAVDAVSRERGLAALRPLLAAAVERAVGTTFDVGVFGRVSAGKSSLINALVGAAVLPVGATPVTAVPVRLTRGTAGVRIFRREGEPLAASLERIADFATEQGNPDNRLGVQAIEATAPTVPEGLRLLDTPGVGSLHTGGAALAFKWLPRCDLGVVLVAAGTAVSRDDLALVSGLHNAGIRCVVLLSKADLLSPADREQSIAYLHRELGAGLGDDARLDVQAVSTLSGADAGLVRFRDDVLAPLAREHEHASRAALVERTRRLVLATGAALRAPPDSGAADLDLQRARAGATGVLRDIVARVTGSAGTILDDAAHALADAWQAGEDGAVAVRRAIMQLAGAALADVRAAVDPVRAVAGDGAIRKSRIPPLFDPAFLDDLPALERPPLARGVVARELARRRLAPIAEPLTEAIQRYAARLHFWGTGTLEELGDAAWVPDGEPTTAALPPPLDAAYQALLDESTGAD